MGTDRVDLTEVKRSVAGNVQSSKREKAIISLRHLQSHEKTVSVSKVAENPTPQTRPATQRGAPLIDAEPHTPRSSTVKANRCSSDMFKLAGFDHPVHTTIEGIKCDIDESGCISPPAGKLTG